MTTNHNFQAGDIVVSTWGCEQTNVDFFQVEKVSAHSVWMRKMQAVITEDRPLAMTGKTVPDATAPLASKILTVRAHGEYAGRTGQKWNGQPERCSWYA